MHRPQQRRARPGQSGNQSDAARATNGVSRQPPAAGLSPDMVLLHHMLAALPTAHLMSIDAQAQSMLSAFRAVNQAVDAQRVAAGLLPLPSRPAFEHRPSAAGPVGSPASDLRQPDDPVSTLAGAVPADPRRASYAAQLQQWPQLPTHEEDQPQLSSASTANSLYPRTQARR